MRGQDAQQGIMWSYLQPGLQVPQTRPLRPIQVMAGQPLKDLSPWFALLYSHTSRPSIPPVQSLRALLLQAFYSVQSERQFMEQLDHNLLFCWFVGLSTDDPIWGPTVFTNNRDRPSQGDIAQAFFTPVPTQARQANLVSTEHFTVDGTLLEAWVNHKSFKSRAGPMAPPAVDHLGKPTVDFRGEKQSNATHQSTTDPKARLVRKSKEHPAILGNRDHVHLKNRSGLVAQAQATQVVDASEPATASALAAAMRGDHPTILGGDKGHDTADSVTGCRPLTITPPCRPEHQCTARECHRGPDNPPPGLHDQVASPETRGEDLRVAETIGQLRKLHHKGTALVNWVFLLRTTAYSLIRMRNPLEATA